MLRPTNYNQPSIAAIFGANPVNQPSEPADDHPMIIAEVEEEVDVFFFKTISFKRLNGWLGIELRSSKAPRKRNRDSSRHIIVYVGYASKK